MGIKAILFLPVLLGLGACNLVGVTCEDYLAPGLRVSPVDSITGEVVAGDIVVIATEGAYADTARIPSDAPNRDVVHLVPERPGTYRVEVQAPGYQPWIRTGIRVTETEDECHVRPVDLIARMQRLDSP